MIRSSTSHEDNTSLGEDVIRQFELAWQAGTRPDIARYLKDSSQLHELLIELVQIELELRYRHHEAPRVEEYFERFPQILDNQGVVIDLIIAEFYLRNRFGHAVTQEEFLKRFPEHRELLQKRFSSNETTLSWTRGRHRRFPRVLPKIPGYVIEEELGQGGMGAVYRATQTALQRAVAIKTLLVGAAATDDLKKRFRNEAEAIARLNHPHLVPVYEVGEWKPEGASATIPYFVMKYYAGGSLAFRATGADSDLQNHVRIMETICLAVHHAHQRGILHRDLKPSNILLDENGEPHVVDFGLAGRFDPNDPKSMTGTIMGTPAYMAPEQARSPALITTAADVYGLGAILYHLLTGRPPFQAETPLAMLERVIHQEPVRPSLLNPKVSRDLDTICLKCLEKDPPRRYESSAALASDLERYRTGKSIIARPLQTWERVWRTVLRHPVIASLVILTLAMLFASVAVLSLSYLRIRAKEEETSDALQREKWAHSELVNTFDREQRLLYGKRISSVGRLWATNQLTEAWGELDLCPERFRGWEWNYFHNLRSKQPATISTPDWVVRCLGFLSEKQLVTGDSLGMVTIWNWQTKIPHASWKVSQYEIRNLAVNIPKKWLAVCDDTQLTVWNYQTQECLAKFPGTMWVAFSPDGNYLASALSPMSTDPIDVTVWETSTWKQKWLLKGHKKLVISGVFSPDSTTLATGSTDGTIRFWNLADGRQLRDPWKRPMPVFGLAWLSDGKHLADAQPSAMLWSDAKTGQEQGRYHWSSTAPQIIVGRVQIATGPDPSLIAFSGPSHDVQVWDIKRNRGVGVFHGHSKHIAALAFSPEGSRLATTGFDQTFRIWEYDQPPEYRSFGTLQQPFDDIVLSADSRYLATIPAFASSKADTQEIHVLRVQDGTELGRFSGGRAAVFTPDGNLLTASHEGGVTCWNLQTKQKIWDYAAPRHFCTSLGISLDGKSVVAVQRDGRIVLLDGQTGSKTHELPVEEQMLGTAQHSRQTNRLAFVGKHEVELWDLVTRSKVSGFPMDGTRRIAFSRDGDIIATVEADRVVHLYQAQTGKLILTFQGHPRSINALAFNADSKRLVTSCADGFIRLWDVETGLELAVLPGQFEENVLVTWDQANDQIVAVDTKVHIWRVGKSDVSAK